VISREQARRYVGKREYGDVADELGPGTYVNLMGQYYPAGKGGDGRYEEIDRRPRADELERAFEIADELGLRRLDRRSKATALSLG
jgi:putative pyruvate formate lyase activating enzyme